MVGSLLIGIGRRRLSQCLSVASVANIALMQYSRYFRLHNTCIFVVFPSHFNHDFVHIFFTELRLWRALSQFCQRMRFVAKLIVTLFLHPIRLEAVDVASEIFICGAE